MNGEEKQFYRFKSFRLDVEERQLLQDGSFVPLTPKAFDVLALLVKRSGHLVEKEELLRIVWSDSFVEETNVARTVHTLRKVLGEDKSENKFIETVAKKGYRFVAEITETSANEANRAPAAPVFESESQKPEQKEARGGEEEEVNKVSVITESRQNNAGNEKAYSGIRRKHVTALAIGLVLVLSGISFWLVNKFLLKPPGVFNARRQTDNGEAYQDYQQGKLLLDRKLKGDYKLALASFEKAIELDPNYAAAYVGKADAEFWMFWSSKTHDDITQARTALNKALELDETNSYAHTMLCRIKATYDWDFDAGAKECLRAIELAPDSPEAHTEWAQFLNVLGQEDQALAEIDTAIKLAPTSFNKRSRGLILYYSRRYDEALAQFRQVIETDPNFPTVDKWLMRSYEMKNDYAQAFEWRLRQIEKEGATPEEIAALKTIYDKNGWNGVIRSMIDSKKPEPRGREFDFTETAIMYCMLGENDKAFESLNKAFEQRELFITLINREPRLDPIRTDTRFKELVKRIGLK